MSNAAINSLYYAGTVSLSLQIEKNKKICLKKIHNAGTSNLFGFFAECLLGNWDLARLARPTKIMLLHVDQEPGSILVSRSRFISVQTEPERVIDDTTGVESVRYSFTIPKAMLEVGSFNRLGLYANTATEPTDYSAYCDIDLNEELAHWGMSSALLIDWELCITNKPSTTGLD